MPFDRKVNPRESLSICRQILESGNVFVLFPEGTRTNDGNLGSFKPVIGLLTAGTPFPVVSRNCSLLSRRATLRLTGLSRS